MSEATPPATTASTAATPSFKEQGNEHYRQGNYLKAAAAYTKALAQDPSSAALYSNRSAALEKLHKLPKALCDAEECVRLRPEWEKGYFRKGAALEALGRLEEAMAAYREAADRGDGSNKQAQEKVRLMQKLVRQTKTSTNRAAAAAATKSA